MSNSNLKYQSYRLIWGLVDLLIPPACGGCDKYGVQWCENCQSKIKILNGVLCDVCGLPQEITGVCQTCLVERPHFHSLRAWAVFDDPLRNALHKLKYRHDISLGGTLAFQMTNFVKELGWAIDVIVPIPLGKKRLKDRGYNQVGMVAKPLALSLQLEYSPDGLKRHKETHSQVGLTRTERRENVRNAFKANGKLKGKKILVIDDVSTTGSTLSSGAEALLSSGAKEVYALAVARALPHHGLKHA